MSRVPEKIEGFEVIKQTSRMRTMYRAPQLNLFTLTELQPCQWRTTELCGVWFHDVKVGPQDVDLFSPPAGAAIEVLTEPGGIVYRPSQP